MKALLLLLLALHGCAMQPAHADAFPPGFVMKHTDHSNTPQASAPTAGPNRGVTLPSGSPGLPPIDSPALRGGPTIDGKPSGLLYDYPISGRRPLAAPSMLATWRGAPETWNPPGINGQGLGDGGGGGGGFPEPPEKPRPKHVVPGPLPVLGAAAAWGWARRLRRRVR